VSSAASPVGAGVRSVALCPRTHAVAQSVRRRPGRDGRRTGEYRCAVRIVVCEAVADHSGDDRSAGCLAEDRVSQRRQATAAASALCSSVAGCVPLRIEKTTPLPA